MKNIYKVELNIYHYWADSCNEGFVREEHYFENEEKANNYLNNIIDNELWVNADNKLVKANENYRKPNGKVRKIELEG